MNLAIASDHTGFEIKKNLVKKLNNEGYNVIDFGCYSDESCDYPDYAIKVSKAVQRKDAKFGILICGSGIGMSIVANKFKGIRAGLCFSEETAKLIAEHNFANIICLPARIKVCGENISEDKLYLWIKIWLTTSNSTEDRHINRIKKIELLEKEIL